MNKFKFLLSVMMLAAVSTFLTPFVATALHTTPIEALAGTFTVGVLGAMLVTPQAGTLTIDPVITGLSSYAGVYAKQLIGQMFTALKDQELTVLENIKVPTKFAKLSVSTGLRPYTSTFVGGDKLNYSDRTLTPTLAKYEVEIEPAKYQGTFMAETTDKNSKAYALPMENFIWMKVIEEMTHELITQTINLGDTGSGTLALAVGDGFKKLIDAIGLSAVATGAPTSANAVTKFEQMYTTWIAANPGWANKPMNLYCSIAQGFNYNIHYRSAFGYDPSIFSDGVKPAYLKISNGMCKVTPVAWLGASNRLILAPKENMAIGTDKLSDMNVINTIRTVWTLQAGIRFLFAAQVLDAGAIEINDQA